METEEGETEAAVISPVSESDHDTIHLAVIFEFQP